MTYKLSKGFTLVELLIVIAVIGVLAGILLVAVNPLEQFARGRDASRKTAVGQLGAAVQAFYTASGGTAYPTQTIGATGWMNTLRTQGEIQNNITGPIYSIAGTSACNGGAAEFNFCYATDTTTWGAVWARMESRAEGGQGGTGSKCPVAGQVAYFIFHSAAGQAGRICSAGVYVPTSAAPVFVP